MENIKQEGGLRNNDETEAVERLEKLYTDCKDSPRTKLESFCTLMEEKFGENFTKFN